MTVCTLEYIPEVEASAFKDSYVKTCLQKWGLTQIKMLTFRFNNPIYLHDPGQFLKTIFNDTVFREHFQVTSKKGAWLALDGAVDSVSWQAVPAKLTAMTLFERLRNPPAGRPPIVHHNGAIVRCMEDFVDGFQVSDNLRDMLLKDESENSDLYSEEEKDQLLYRIFRHVSLGGGVCQFEDELEPYLEVTKKIYKTMLRVHKNTSTGEVEVASQVFSVLDMRSEAGTKLFPHISKNNFMYVVTDALYRTCKILYNAYLPFW